MRPTSRAMACIAGALSLVVACEQVDAPLAPTTSVRKVDVVTTGEGRILLDIQLSESATLDITYWTDPGRKLLIHQAQTALSTSVLLPYVEAGKHYQYSVSAVTSSGGQGPAVGGLFVTPALPLDLQSAQITVTGRGSSPLTMLELNGDFKGFVLVDDAGSPVWWWRTQGTPQGFCRRANGNFVFNDFGVGLFEVSADGQTVHQLLASPTGFPGAHHDVIATPANTILFIAQDIRAVADTSLVGDAIWEWVPESGVSERRWSVFDFYDPSRDVGLRSRAYDWVHANSLALGDHGNVILSLNWLSQVLSIAPGWQSIEWKVGGPGSTYSVDTEASFQGQHAASLLPNGNLLLFDNGRERPEPRHYSRGLELSLDPATRTAHQVWSFRTNPDTYAPYIGSARRLANGNTLVDFGIPGGGIGGASGPLSVYEVTPGGSVTWTLAVANLTTLYRATPVASMASEILIR